MIMKKVHIIPVLTLALIILIFATNCTKSADEKTKTFLTEMTDARLMDREEGREAAKKGTTQQIKNYGALMIEEQTYLLSELREFAATKNITLPTKISEEKQNALKDLKEKSGVAFDKKFIKMIRIDHKRDVRKFKKASKCDDPELSSFATKHLPMIESHLQKIEQIKKSN
jgi:putative membrane protein